MKLTKLALSLLVGMGTGCAMLLPAPFVSIADLPNCFDTNYDKERDLFTIRNHAGNAVNQQCLLTVGPRGDVASASRLRAGSYRVYLSNGGGGGAGGTMQASGGGDGGGGGGGGGAGAMEVQATVNLTEGSYRLTIGAGGPGGSVCVPGTGGFGGGPGGGIGGGPGWLGSPSNMIRVATGELVIGTPGAESYARPTRAQADRMGGTMDAHGGSGPGQTSGGQGARPEASGKVEVEAQRGGTTLESGRSGVAGAAGADTAEDKRPGGGGGGGAARLGPGGGGGGESAGQAQIAPQRGTLGGGGGGGEGSTYECDPGSAGGHGYIALRPI